MSKSKSSTVASATPISTWCATNGAASCPQFTADVEIIPIQKANEAYERLLKSDVKYRFCIDMASLKA